MIIEREFAIPSKNTFSIKPIARLLKEETIRPVLDPFPYPYQSDARDNLQKQPDLSYNTVYFDAPYSPTQLKEHYHNKGMALNKHDAQFYWLECERHIYRILKPGGKMIKFGWNSSKQMKHFTITRIMLINHGLTHNDTIITVQQKVNHTLDEVNDHEVDRAYEQSPYLFPKK